MLRGLFLTLFFLSNVSWAEGLTLGTPRFSGNGCHEGSSSATLSPDASTLSILFDAFTVEAGSKKQDRKECNMDVPVYVPEGKSVTLFQLDFRGYNLLPMGAFSILTSQYHFGNEHGPRTAKTFVGVVDENYLVTDTIDEGRRLFSKCGKETKLKIISSIRVETNSSKEQALSTVDSLDMGGSLIYHVQIRDCRR